MKMYQSLHCHTKTSDGELNYREVLNICTKNNIGVIAFTDHDALPNEKMTRWLLRNKNHKTKWIMGIEISSGWPREIGGPASNFHIVGLFINPFDKDLLDYCQKSQEARIERMRRMVKNLQNLGFIISVDDCLREAKREIVCRPHIVAALRRRRENLEIIQELKYKMEEAAKHDQTIRKRYNKMIARDEDQYPYFLFLDSKAFLPGIFVDHLYWKDMDETVNLIRKAGGVAILAHWTFTKDKVPAEMIEKFFQEKRLDGAEIVFCSPDAESMKGEIRQDMETIQRITERYSVLQSGGFDLHKKEDFGYLVSQKWLAGKTVGLVQKMMKKRVLNLSFSSFSKLS